MWSTCSSKLSTAHGAQTQDLASFPRFLIHESRKASFPFATQCVLMGSARLLQCQGDTPTYIKHLELRVIYLEATRDTPSYLDSRNGQHRTGEQTKSCDVCQTPDRYAGSSSTYAANVARNQPYLDETCSDDLQIEFWKPKEKVDGKSTTKGRASTVDGAEDLPELCSKFECLPESGSWKVLLFSDDVQKKEIVRHLISGLAPSESSSSSKPSSDPLVLALSDYSKSISATSSAKKKSVIHMFSRACLLFHVCCCENCYTKRIRV